MRIHLITVVGSHVDVLPHMLAHYRAQGVDSFLINVQLQDPADPVLEEVRAVTRRFDCEVATVAVGEWQSVQHGLWETSRRLHPDEWCVLADQDELHEYPDRLSDILAYCDEHHYDYVTGAFVDRTSADGSFPAVGEERPLGEQFPLGGFLTHPILGADPRKVVVTKGRVSVCRGQHFARDGVGCPIDRLFVPVHHFKWTAGLVERLRARAARLRQQNVDHWFESDRFVSYYEAHGGRIDLSDSRFRVAPCQPSYPYWPRVTEMAIEHERNYPRVTAP